MATSQLSRGGLERVPVFVIVALSFLAGSAACVASIADAPVNENPDRPWQELWEQILAISRMPSLDLQKAAALVESTLRPDPEILDYRSDWTIAPTAAIAEGTAMRGKGGKEMLYFSIVPRVSLDLAFEDVARQLLDLQFCMRPQSVNVTDDSRWEEIDYYQYRFVVPVGELILEVPVNIPFGVPRHDGKAIAVGYDTADGVSDARRLIKMIHVTNERTPGWEKRPTLRQFRARRTKPPAGQSAPPARIGWSSDCRSG
jgi:hypothetical protein